MSRRPLQSYSSLRLLLWGAICGCIFIVLSVLSTCNGAYAAASEHAHKRVQPVYANSSSHSLSRIRTPSPHPRSLRIISYLHPQMNIECTSLTLDDV